MKRSRTKCQAKGFYGESQVCVISLYVKRISTRQISETIEDIYGFEVSDGLVSDITGRLARLMSVGGIR